MNSQKLIPRYTDRDTDELMLPTEQGAVKGMLNVRIGSDVESSNQVVNNIQGNQLINNSALPTGTNTCIGSYEYTSAQELIYFIHNMPASGAGGEQFTDPDMNNGTTSYSQPSSPPYLTWDSHAGYVQAISNDMVHPDRTVPIGQTITVVAGTNYRFTIDYTASAPSIIYFVNTFLGQPFIYLHTENISGSGTIIFDYIPATSGSMFLGVFFTRITTGFQYLDNIVISKFSVSNAPINEPAHSIWKYSKITGLFTNLLTWKGLNFSTNIDKRINGVGVIGNILYWNDHNNRPRRLNLDKAEPNKPLKVRVCFEKYFYYGGTTWNFRDGFTKNFRLVTSNGTDSIISGTFNWVNFNTFLTNYVAAVNAITGIPFFAEVKDDYILLTGKTNGLLSISLLPDTADTDIHYWLVYENFYPQPYIEEQFSLHRPTPTVPIANTIRLNDNAKYTLPKEQNILQFAWQLVFFDGERSSVSPYSKRQATFFQQRPHTTALADTKPNVAIDLDFSDDKTMNGTNYLQYLSEIKEINILVNRNNASKWNLYTTYRPFPGFNVLYDNSLQLSGVADSLMTRYFDAIPDKSRTEEIHSNRIFLANNTEGFDNINQGVNFKVLFGFAGTLSLDTWSKPMFYHRGGKYKFGIVFYDRFGKSSSVMTNPGMFVSIPFYSQKVATAIPAFDVTNANVQLVGTDYSHDPCFIQFDITKTGKQYIPENAYTYQFVRTKNQVATYWDTFPVAYNGGNHDIKYVGSYPILAGGGDDIDNPTFVAWNVAKIEVWFKLDQAYNSYNLQTGDKVKVIGITDKSTYYYDIDVVIKRQVGNYIIVDWAAMNIPNTQLETLVPLYLEIYTPKPKEDEELFYEIGEVFQISSPEADERAFGTTTGVLADGDAFKETSPTYVASGAKNPYIEAPYPVYGSQAYAGYKTNLNKTWIQNIGRVNYLDSTAKKTVRKSAIRFSDKYIQNTNLNGLSTFQPLNEAELPNNGGEITKLVKADQTMLVLQTNTAHSAYIDQSELRDLTGSKLVAISDDVIGKPRELEGDYGCNHPESVQVYTTRVVGEQSPTTKVYYYSWVRGEVVRYAKNGSFPISQYGMRNFFYNKRRKFLNTTCSTLLLGSFDPYFQEYNIHFPAISGTITESAETIIFSEGGNQWLDKFSLTAGEHYDKLSTYLVSFKNGQIWLHNSTTYCNYFGVQYNAEIRVVSNQAPNQVKIFRIVSVEANKLWFAPSIVNSKSQASELLVVDFEEKEGVWYAKMLRDSNTPNITNPLLEGDELRDKYVEILLRANDPSVRNELFAVNVQYLESSGHSTYEFTIQARGLI